MDRDFRESQIRIEGKIDRLGDAMQRHGDDMRDVKLTLHAHSNRIGVLEADKNVREGERKGLTASGKLLWGLVSAVLGGGGVFTIVELLK